MCDSGFSGTSAATPMVTGAIALALEAKYVSAHDIPLWNFFLLETFTIV